MEFGRNSRSDDAPFYEVGAMELRDNHPPRLIDRHGEGISVRPLQLLVPVLENKDVRVYGT
jgi:hypothetical protein